MTKGKISIIVAILMLGLVAFFPLRASLSAPDKAEIETIIRNYLTQNPEVLKEALQALQEHEMKVVAQRQTQSIKENQQELFSSTSPSEQNGEPKITIVEFFDYQCHYCKKLYPELTKVYQDNKDLKVVYKELPLLGQGSVIAAQAALAAQKQDKYMAFHNSMMTLNGKITEEVVFDKAKEVGLDVDKLKQDMKDPSIQKELEQNRQLAQNIGLRGTPALIIAPQPMTKDSEPTYIPGAIDAAQLQKIINETKAKVE